VNCKDKESKNAYFYELDKIVFETLLKANSVIIILDTSIKNNITTSITHVYSCSNFIKKILHHAINITITEAELFAIRCGISQATQFPDISSIIIITDSIHVARRIFDSTIHLQSIVISKNLRLYFNRHSDNSIKFWDYPSNNK